MATVVSRQCRDGRRDWQALIHRKALYSKHGYFPSKRLPRPGYARRSRCASLVCYRGWVSILQSSSWCLLVADSVRHENMRLRGTLNKGRRGLNGYVGRAVFLTSNERALLRLKPSTVLGMMRVPAQGGHPSDLMAVSIPGAWRSAFRCDGGHFRCLPER